MPFYSKSYNAASCCGDDCSYNYLSTEGEPCWGEVEVVGEDYSEYDWTWYHACQGHHNFYDDAWDNPKYIPEL
jgi:hypothetical protein